MEDVNERILIDLTEFFLASHTKHGKIKTADITTVLNEYGKAETRKKKEWVDRVKEQLGTVFSITVLTHKDSSCYYLQNQLPYVGENEIGTQLRHSLGDREHDGAIKALRFNILAYIFMKQPRELEVPHEELVHYLNFLGVDLTDKNVHPVFGDLKLLLCPSNPARPGEFVSHGWLCVKKVAAVGHNEGPPDYKIGWGWRAEKVVKKKKLLDEVCRIFGDGCRPEEWEAHLAVIASESEQDNDGDSSD